jgi:uncharacterized protein involved in response to NO
MAAASLHAFAQGFLGPILLAMLPRIVGAQTGRTVVADDLLWRLFWLLQVAVVLRVSRALEPALAHVGRALRAMAGPGRARRPDQSTRPVAEKRSDE